MDNGQDFIAIPVTPGPRRRWLRSRSTAASSSGHYPLDQNHPQFGARRRSAPGPGAAGTREGARPLARDLV